MRESLIIFFNNNNNNDNNEEIGILTAIYISRERCERRKAREREVAGSYTKFNLTKYQFHSEPIFSQPDVLEQINLHHKNVWLMRP